jgi:hypothetical protein
VQVNKEPTEEVEKENNEIRQCPSELEVENRLQSLPLAEHEKHASEHIPQIKEL